MDYYNEIDAFAAQWLRNLSGHELIPTGEVDERSICDVRSEDLRRFRRVHLFAGIGGWAEACRLAGWPGAIPIWSGSCPCQPFSLAGKRKGKEDSRHLWPEMFRLIQDCRPPVVVGEQVSQKDGLAWLDGVCDDLEGIGYTCGAYDLAAGGFSAPHKRQRLYWFGFLDVSTAQGCDVGGVVYSNGRGCDWGESTSIATASCSPVQAEANGSTCGMEHTSSSQCRWASSWQQLIHEQHDAGVAQGNTSGSGREVRCSIGGNDRQELASPFGAGDLSVAVGHSPSILVDSGSRESKWGSQGRDADPWADSVLLPCTDGKVRRVGSRVSPLAHGIPRSVGSEFSRSLGMDHDTKGARALAATARRNRTGRLRGYGNAIVPYVAAEFLKVVLDLILSRHGGGRCDSRQTS